MVDPTPELLDELERLEREATAGPWLADYRGEHSGHGDMLRHECRSPNHGVLFDTLNADVSGIEQCPDDDGVYYRDPVGRANVELVVALRNAAPALLSTARLASARLAEVRRLRKLLPRLKRGHDSDCGVREDDGYVRCTCGAIADNALIDAALAGGEGPP